MKNKNLISLTIGFAFLAMSITGILLYIKQKSHAIEITHTVVGLLFVGFAIFHISNNWSSITGYSKSKKTGKIQKEFIWAGFIALLVTIGGLTEVLEPVAEVGKLFASGKKGANRPPSLAEVETNKESKGTAFNVVVVKNKGAEAADVALWAEDSTGKVVESILVTQKFTTTNKLTPNTEKPVMGSFVLTSKTTVTLPITLKMEVKNGDKTEAYQAKITGFEDNAFALKGKNNEFVKTGVISFN